MIDIEPDVFDECARAVLAAYPEAYVASRNVAKPPSFPAVMIVEASNLPDEGWADSSGRERAARVRYRAQVYSNSQEGGKRECKAITAIIADVMEAANMARTMCAPVDNAADPTVSRMVSEYSGVVDERHMTYRR